RRTRSVLCVQPFVSAGHRLHRLICVICVIRGFSLSCLFGSLFLRGLRALLRSFSSLNFARVINQFDYRQLSRVALAATEFQNARVTAGTILVALAEIIEQPAQRCDARSAF